MTVPSPHGHSLPRLTVAAIHASTMDLPSPPSPATSTHLPRGNRCSQSQSIFSGLMSAAHLTTRREFLGHLTQRHKPCNVIAAHAAALSSTSTKISTVGVRRLKPFLHLPGMGLV